MAEITRQMYLGPSHPKAILVSGAIFKNGIPKQIEALLEKCPSAKSLLVTTDKVAKVRTNLRNSNSASSALYKQAEEELHANLYIGVTPEDQEVNE